ncbi:MAG: phosphatidate cytidylyltransferase [Chloroflexota bacterium]|nr:phosphatidate cytidylyltransferase [Chloroflexota bacterium]
MLRTRLITAAILVPIVLAVIAVGEPWISILVALIIFLGLAELISLIDAAGFDPPQMLLLIGGVAVGGAGLLVANQDNISGLPADLLRATQPVSLVVIAFIAAVLLLSFAGFTRADPRRGFATWAVSSFGVAYLCILAPYIVLVAHLAPSGGSAASVIGPLNLRSGTAWAVLLVLVVWGYDSGAFLTGRWLGRTRLITHISPSKTVEGLAGGLVVATLGAGLGGWLVGLPAWHPLVVGPVVGLAAQAGDLAESMLKRAADRKESGFLIPGHGGVLDRIDSFLFAAPVLAAYALLVAGYVV